MECHIYRLSLKNVTQTAVLDSNLLSDASAYAYGIEGHRGNNPHMHLYVRNMKKHATYVKRLSRMGLKGNGDFAFSKLDRATLVADHPIKYLAYLMKEGNFTSYKLPEATLALARAYDDEKKKEKKARLKQWEKIMATIDKSALPPHSGNAYHYILRRTIEYYKENSICLKKFNIISTAETITLHLLENGVDYIFLEYSRHF